MTGETFEFRPPSGWPVDSDWTEPLAPMFSSPAFEQLIRFVDRERQTEAIFPPPAQVFEAFRLSSRKATRVVILGQDPYHGPDQAHGLSFSVASGVNPPRSLKNIFRELHDDVGCEVPTSGDLSSWARQGVLLLNTVLTVRSGEAHSHRKQGWELFTDEVIRILNQDAQRRVFVLWGRPAQQKSDLLDARHTVIMSPHPSPLSARRGFFGSRPFSRINQALIESGQAPIDWKIEA